MAQKGLITQDLSKELVRGKQAAFQYKPLEDTQLAWLARTENERNYLESERKAKEQRDLRDNLAKIEALGLPKEMQGYLNSNVEDLINKVRAGEIDPESYDFRRMVQTISGEANQLNNINNNLKTLAAEDKQVIIDGRDVSRDYKDQYISAYNTTYVPGTDLYNKFVGLQEGLMRGTEAIEFDDTTANNLLNDYIERNVNTNANISKLKEEGYTGYNLIKKLATLDKDAAQNWIDYLNTQSQTSLISEYAKAEKTANAAGIPIEPYEEWKKDRLKNFIPNLRQVTDASIEEDQYSLEKFKKKDKRKYTLVSNKFKIPEVNYNKYSDSVEYQNQYYQNIANSVPNQDLNKEDVAEIVKYFPPGTDVKESLITTAGQGQALTEITIGEQVGVFDRVLSSNGVYVAVISVETEKTRVDNLNLPPDQQTVIEETVVENKYVPIKEVDVRKIEENYGVSIIEEKNYKFGDNGEIIIE